MQSPTNSQKRARRGTSSRNARHATGSVEVAQIRPTAPSMTIVSAVQAKASFLTITRL
jgi:hypothetical protein